MATYSLKHNTNGIYEINPNKQENHFFMNKTSLPIASLQSYDNLINFLDEADTFRDISTLATH